MQGGQRMRRAMSSGNNRVAAGGEFRVLAAFCLALALCVLPIAGCGALDGLSSGEASGSAQRSASETVSIVYDPALLNVMGYESADEAVEESGASHDPGSESGYLGATARDDGSVELTYSAEQYDYTVDWTKGQIESACASFASYYAGCSLEVAEDWQTIDCYLTPDVATSVGTWLSAIQEVEVCCAQMQALEHPGDGTWAATIRLYNVETGELVTSASSEGGTLSFTPEGWA